METPKNSITLRFRKYGISSWIVAIYFLTFFQIPTLLLAQNPNEIKVNEKEMEAIKKTMENDSSIAVKLTEDELENFKISVEHKINELQNDITIIANKSETEKNRQDAITSALKLFIADAKMQVSNKVTLQLSTFPMKTYFIRLKSLPYTKVEINFYEIAYISKFYEGADGNYHATATIFQEFKAFSGDNIVYTDRTQKTIDIILEYGEDEYFKTKRWIVKLGNIRVLETT